MTKNTTINVLEIIVETLRETHIDTTDRCLSGYIEACDDILEVIKKLVEIDLDEIVCEIENYYEPEEVFRKSKLKKWAIENGYIQDGE